METLKKLKKYSNEIHRPFDLRVAEAQLDGHSFFVRCQNMATDLVFGGWTRLSICTYIVVCVIVLVVNAEG
jgi:hypothetical protein